MLLAASAATVVPFHLFIKAVQESGGGRFVHISLFILARVQHFFKFMLKAII